VRKRTETKKLRGAGQSNCAIGTQEPGYRLGFVPPGAAAGPLHVERVRLDSIAFVLDSAVFRDWACALLLTVAGNAAICGDVAEFRNGASSRARTRVARTEPKEAGVLASTLRIVVAVAGADPLGIVLRVLVRLLRRVGLLGLVGHGFRVILRVGVRLLDVVGFGSVVGKWDRKDDDIGGEPGAGDDGRRNRKPLCRTGEACGCIRAIPTPRTRAPGWQRRTAQ